MTTIKENKMTNDEIKRAMEFLMRMKKLGYNFSSWKMTDKSVILYYSDRKEIYSHDRIQSDGSYIWYVRENNQYRPLMYGK